MTLAEDFRAELLARDARLLRQQTRTILSIIRALDTRITELSEAVGPGSVTRLAEYQALRAAAVAELTRFATSVAGAIERAEEINVEAAVEESRLLVEALLPPGLTFAAVGWSTPSAGELLSTRLADGTPLTRHLTARIVRGTMTMVRETLTSGIGDNPKVTARALREAFAGGMSTALRVTRTETLRAYRDAARASYEANPHLVRGYRRHAALDSRTCAACYLLDGTLYASSSDMEEHVQGRCYLSPELVSWRELGIAGVPDEPIERTGRERFLELSEEEQRDLIHNDRQFELLRAGRIGLSDLIQRRVHPDFGASLTQASARASLNREGTLSRLPSTEEITPIASLVTPSIRTAA